MQRKFVLFLISFGIMVASAACGKKTPTQPDPSQIIAEGWQAFSQQDYQTAFDKFTEAISINALNPEGYTGLGWSLLELDRLSESDIEFGKGVDHDPGADLYAGWAFTLNGLKSYTKSNTEIDAALAKDSNWTFSHGLTLNSDDLTVLKAENYFLLGDFTDALTQVKALNPAFSADITNSDGQAALATEIERLKSVM